MFNLGPRSQLSEDLHTLFGVAWPLILNNLFSIGVNVADTLMVGRLGATQLAALGIGSGLWIGIFLGGLGVLMSLGPTVAQHFGAQQYAAIGHDVKQAAWLAILLAGIVFVALNSVRPLLTALHIDLEVSDLVVGYLRALSFGVPGLYLYHVLRQMNEGIGRTVPIMVVTGIALAINVALSFMLVFGVGSVAKLGVIGSGLGSAISYWCMFAFLAFHMWHTPHYGTFELKSVVNKPEWKTLQRLIKLGGPIGLSLMLQAGLFAALALLIGTLGRNFSAAHQITLNYAGLVFMVPLGFAFATAVLVGQAIGRNEPKIASRIGHTGISICFTIAATIAGATYWCAPYIPLAYTHDRAVISISTSLLAISAFLQLGDGTQCAAAGALRGLKDTRVPMLLNAFIYWVIGFVTAYTLGIYLHQGARGIWCGLALALCTAAVVLLLRFRRVIKRRIALRPIA